MAKKPTIRPLQDKLRPDLKWRVFYPSVDGKRKQRKFRTKAVALNFLNDKLVDYENLGNEIFSTVDDKLKREAFQAVKALQPYNKSITEAVEYYLDHLKTTQASRPVGELVQDFHVMLANTGKSDRYRSDQRIRLARFIENYGDRYASEITTRMADEWLSRLDVGSGTKNHYRRLLSSFFSWCERQGYVPENPINKATRYKEVRADTEIFTVAEMRAVLILAAKLDNKDILATVILGAFAGLRASEIARLTWQDIYLQRNLIKLTYSKTKTGARRLVKIQPVLREWIKKYFSKAQGSIQVRNYTNRIKAFRQILKERKKPVRWKQNALRHSYG